MKLKPQDLNTLYSMAKAAHNADAHRGLDDQQTLAKCWLIAVSTFLNIKIEYSWPNDRPAIIPDDED